MELSIRFIIYLIVDLMLNERRADNKLANCFVAIFAMATKYYRKLSNGVN